MLQDRSYLQEICFREIKLIKAELVFNISYLSSDKYIKKDKCASIFKLGN